MLTQFLYEKDLKELFSKSYVKRPAVLRYQFEASVRAGAIDLLTIELVKDEINICAFEFKLNDIKKVLTQAVANIPFCSKSFAVIPLDKKQLILDKYLGLIKSYKYLGIIGINTAGRWEMIHQPRTKPLEEIQFTNEILKLMVDKI